MTEAQKFALTFPTIINAKNTDQKYNNFCVEINNQPNEVKVIQDDLLTLYRLKKG